MTKALLATKIQNLEGFRFLFEDESKVDTFLAKLQLGEERLIQGSRLRWAWTAVTLYYKNQDQDRSKVSLSDLDTMLANNELRDVKTNFWIRYHMRYHPEIHPADATRGSRELSRGCCVCTTFGRSGHFSISSIPPRRNASWPRDSTLRMPRMRTRSPMIGRTTWIV